jgi:hypothetical protein
MRAAGALIAVTAVLALPIRGADLVEPWALRTSTLELYAATGDDPSSLLTVLGYGLSESISLGVSLEAAEGTTPRAGFTAIFTRILDPRSELDLWVEVGYSGAVPETETGRTCLTLGSEWSRRLPGVVTYARLSAARESGETSVHPLLGIMRPLGARLELHLEISSLREGGQWPLHVAIGPNLAIADRLELIPEISWIRMPGGSATWQFSLGLIWEL